ncbi:hypothetical protein ACWEYW_02715 [Staphylococcus xylosus]
MDFVSVEKKCDYWWSEFKYPIIPSASRFYYAIPIITDKQERIK